ATALDTRYTVSLHDALPILDMRRMDYSNAIYGPSLERPINLNDVVFDVNDPNQWIQAMCYETNEQNRNPDAVGDNSERTRLLTPDRKSTRLNSSHVKSSYAG